MEAGSTVAKMADEVAMPYSAALGEVSTVVRHSSGDGVLDPEAAFAAVVLAPTKSGEVIYTARPMTKGKTAMAYKKLSELTTRGQTCNIKVKVMRMWDSINLATDELLSLDMILMDEQGDVIHATKWKNLIDSYKTKINESSVYIFSNFKVQESHRYHPVDNDLKITFMYNTKVKQVKESAESFPKYYFDFATSDTLQDRANKDQHLS
ncbi:hypothetical protein E2562_001308, partial [Oryza meyeriana var. granulata]